MSIDEVEQLRKIAQDWRTWAVSSTHEVARIYHRCAGELDAALNRLEREQEHRR